MRLVSPGGGGGGGVLEMPWNRNPSFVMFTYTSENVAPHGITQRWIYTVPAGRRAQVNYIGAGAWRDSAPTTAGMVRSFVQVNTGAGWFTICIIRLTALTGNSEVAFAYPQFILSEGHAVRGQTSDGSTGGTCSYLCAVAITEFDA